MGMRVTGVLMVGSAAWLTAMTAVLSGGGQSSSVGTVGGGQAPAAGSYAGSAACARCHAPIYERWKRTRMANVVRDPKDHPDAIIPDLSRPDPLLTFTRGDIAFVYGSKWKQRYFTKVGDDYF